MTLIGSLTPSFYITHKFHNKQIINKAPFLPCVINLIYVQFMFQFSLCCDLIHDIDNIKTLVVFLIFDLIYYTFILIKHD